MVKYRIRIDREACIGDKQCGEEAPNTFFVDDEGVSIVLESDGDPPEQILRAAQKCLYQAISLIDAETGEPVEIPDNKVEKEPVEELLRPDLGGGD